MLFNVGTVLFCLRGQPNFYGLTRTTISPIVFPPKPYFCEPLFGVALGVKWFLISLSQTKKEVYFILKPLDLYTNFPIRVTLGAKRYKMRFEMYKTDRARARRLRRSARHDIPTAGSGNRLDSQTGTGWAKSSDLENQCVR